MNKLSFRKILKLQMQVCNSQHKVPASLSTVADMAGGASSQNTGLEG